jgi:hypothetical protein
MYPDPVKQNAKTAKGAEVSLWGFCDVLNHAG